MSSNTNHNLKKAKLGNKLYYKHDKSGLYTRVNVQKSKAQPKRKLTSIYNVNKFSGSKLSYKENLGFAGTALSVIVLVLLILVVMRFLLVPSAPIYTFESLLEVLQGTPTMQPWSQFLDLTIYTDWGIFNFLRDFINLNTGIIEFGLWVVNLLTYTLEFIGYYLFAFFNIVMF